MSIRENLIDAKALIDTPEKWGKGPDGLNPPACGLCAMNVLRMVTDRDYALMMTLEAHLPEGPWDGRDGLPVAVYNDAPSTTHADIMALFDRAIAAQDAP